MTIDTLICVHSTDNLHDHLLGDAIRSVMRGSIKPNNLVIVFDACWKNTQIYVDNIFNDGLPWEDQVELKTTHYIPVAKSVKQGLAVAKNFGLKFCTSDYITYCDADDQWINSKLEIQRDFLTKNPNIDFCFTQSWDIRSDGALVPNCFPVGYAINHKDIALKIRNENCLCHGSVMIKREVLEQMGGYNIDRRFIGMEDWNLWQRAFDSGYIFHNIPERLYCYRLGTSVER